MSGLESLRCLTHVHFDMCAPYMELPRCSVAVYEGLSSFKFDHVLDVFPAGIPSLVYIAITSRGNAFQPPTAANGFKEREKKWETSRAWRVRRDIRSASAEPGRRPYLLEELGEAEVETVNDTEELYDTASYDVRPRLLIHLARTA